MRRVLRVFLVLVSSLALVGGVVGQEAIGEGESPVGETDFRLEQNYPNPFNPETRIPFVLDEELFRNGRPVVVTLRIYNVLQQFVDNPTALNHPRGDGTPVRELEYTAPGRHEAYWDGVDRSGDQVASGVYFVQLVVNGRSQVRKMFVTK